MVPIRSALEKLATDLGKTYSDYNKLCEDNDIIQVSESFTFFLLLANMMLFLLRL